MTMAAVADADLATALQGGVEALCGCLFARLAEGVSHEDQPFDRQLLEAACRTCADAASAAGAAGQPLAQAVASIGHAAALAATGSLASIRQAEEALISGLTLMRAGAPAGIRLEAYLLLGDLLARVVDAVAEEEREAFIDRGVGLTRAAEYMAVLASNDLARARALGNEAVLTSRRFGGARDGNLMDAIDCGTRAFALLGEGNVRSAVRWPLLLLEMGNAAVKIEASRQTWLVQARRFYNLGRSVAEAGRYPELVAALAKNCAMWNAQGEHDLKDLPPDEAFARFRYRVRRAEAAGETEAALATVSELARWAQGLARQPNLYVGHAQLLRGRLLLARSAWSEAVAALDSAAAVFGAVFHDDPRGQQLVQQALQLRAWAMAGLTKPDTSDVSQASPPTPPSPRRP